MKSRLHPHASDRLAMRGASEFEVINTVESGEPTPANLGRIRYTKTFHFNAEWRGRQYATKTIEAYAVNEEGWLVITVIVKFGGRMP
jgi:hypothetical protein